MTLATREFSRPSPGRGVVWIVVRSKPNCEALARDQLDQQGFETYLPMRLAHAVKRPGAAPELSPRPFLPRYLFARVGLQLGDWKRIWSTKGVQSVLGSVAQPYGLADWVIERIQTQEDAGFIKMGLATDSVKFQAGQRVRMPALEGIEGVFLEQVDERRCAILVSLLGRDSRVAVDLSKLRATIQA
jgi:transcriptional antiterminator RfaH